VGLIFNHQGNQIELSHVRAVLFSVRQDLKLVNTHHRPPPLHFPSQKIEKAGNVSDRFCEAVEDLF
jgi:hypothetical protein